MEDFFKETFENLNRDKFQVGEYEQCIFINCDFSNANLSGVKFVDCQFKNCGLSLVNLSGTTINDVKFIQCKMLGLRFDHCNPFTLSFSFDDCALNDSSFFKCKLKKSKFKNTQFHRVDFAQCDLSESSFDNCDLKESMFENTNLQKADLRSAINYSINPEVNQIKKAKFSASGLRGLLEKYDITVEL